MKNILCTALAFILLLPAFLPLAPHGAAHALYNAHTSHHGEAPHHRHAQVDHSHDHGMDFHGNQENITHGLMTDIVSYYADFLHVDLKNADAEPFVPASLTSAEPDYNTNAVLASAWRYEIAALRTRGPPPPNLTIYLNGPPLYLTTQRLRI